MPVEAGSRNCNSPVVDLQIGMAFSSAPSCKNDRAEVHDTHPLQILVVQTMLGGTQVQSLPDEA